MTATTIIKQAKILLQASMILISLCVLPIMIGMVGRSMAHDQAVAAVEPQLDRPVFHW
jgi:uncharacterized membrane protein